MVANSDLGANRLASASRFDGRLIVAGVLLLYAVVICLAGWSGVGAKAWRWLGVQSISPGFVDAWAITGSWDSLRMGYDPSRYNPGHPIGGLMNYPQLWMVPSLLGFGGKDTTVFACGAVGAFWVTALLLMGRLSLGQGWLYTLLLCSPAAMLAVERGNCDLIIFALLGGGVLLVQSRPALGYGLVLLAAFLKLFPIFALMVAVRERKRMALVTIGVVGMAFLAYVVLTLSDFVQVWRVSKHLGVDSYGCLTLAYKIEDSLQFRGLHPGYLPAVFALSLVLTIIVLAWSIRSGLRLSQSVDASTRKLDAFRAGAAAYAGSFLLGSNFIYRYIFLLLTVPQLLIWMAEPKDLKRPARRSVGCIVAAMWIYWVPVVAPTARPFIVPIAELLNWALFAMFVMLLVATAPAWSLEIFNRNIAGWRPTPVTVGSQ